MSDVEFDEPLVQGTLWGPDEVLDYSPKPTFDEASVAFLHCMTTADPDYNNV
ncbi:hypothetical protein KBX39_00190 [Micromonospora sp. D75]|nr:hypothetical protein [Micromonospora sp. D75]